MTIPTDQINLPEILAELHALYPRYEQALMSNDIPTLVEMFWPSPHVMRFGVTENLYGHEELEAFRQSRPAANLARTVTRLDIVTFGNHTASVTLEFERSVPETASSPAKLIRGRQSQLWIRLSEGWKIVSAHVSVLPQS